MLSKEEFEKTYALLFRRFEEETGDRVIFSFPTNLNEKGEREDSVVLFGEKHLSLFSRDRFLHLPIESIRDSRYRLFLGGGVCEILVDEEWREFCRAFSEEKENVSQLVRVLKEVAQGVLRPADARFSYRKTLCPNCRRPMIHKGMTVCSVCAGKEGGWKKLLEIVRPQMGWLLLTMALFFVTGILNLVLPRIQGTLVDDYLTVPDAASVLNSFSTVIWIVVSMALLRIVIVLSSILRNNILSKVSVKTTVGLRHLVYEKIQSLSVAGISSHTAGDLINRVSRDTTVISNFLNSQAPNCIEQTILIVLISIFLFLKSWKLGLLILIPVPFVVLMFRLVWKRNRRYYSRQWVENANANTVLHDTFQGVRVVKVFGTEKKEIEKYDKAILAQRDISYRNEKAWAKVTPYADFLLQVGSFFLLYFVGNEILHERMTVGEMTMFSSYVSLLYGPLRWMSHLPAILQGALTSVYRVFEVLEEEPDVADKEGALDFPLKGKVEIDGIWFGYNENENVLENVSVTVKPGEMLGIVGKSGVGKSTLINLIMRLYDVRRGKISIDGVDVREISQHCLRSQIGVVLQESFLFSGTLFENIAYAKPEATFREVMAAAKFANAHSFIMKLPDGYNTFVGEKGYTLSGGERQRIAIARAILHDPKILILDEATSALDTETEKLVQDALVRLCKDRTTIAIAHRLSTLRNATKLLVLDGKTVAEVGTHEELMQKEGGIYQGLVLAQREMSSIKKKPREEN